MAVPVTPAERPARAVSPRHFVRLKLRVLRNNFRGQAWRIAMFVGGVLFGLWFAVGGFFLLAAPGLAGESRYALMTAAFGGKVDELVPQAVAKRFRELYPNGRPGAPLSPAE